MTISTIKARHADYGGHFFDPATMRGFKSRIEPATFKGQSHRIYFATSEADEGIPIPRVWSVRVCHYDGSIDTVTGLPGSIENHPACNFKFFPSRKAAYKAAAHIASADNRAMVPTGNREMLYAMRLGLWDGGVQYGHAARYCPSADFLFMPGHVESMSKGLDADRDIMAILLECESRTDIERCLSSWPSAD